MLKGGMRFFCRREDLALEKNLDSIPKEVLKKNFIFIFFFKKRKKPKPFKIQI